MHRRGFTTVRVYLDDFYMTSHSFDHFMLILNTLMALLIELGFYINYSKVVGPTQSLVFLGIEINSIDMSISLPKDKLSDLKQMLNQFRTRRRASKRQLQRLAGSLNWASKVVRGGRTFLRRIIDAQNRLKGANHKMLLKDSVRADIHWWIDFMSTFNGRSLLLDKVPMDFITMDACNIGGGATFAGRLACSRAFAHK